MTDVSAGAGKEPLGVRDPLDRVRRLLGLGIVGGGQAIDLFGVEDGIAFEEGDSVLFLLTVIVCLAAGEGVGVDDERSFLAAADLAAQLGRLAVGHPQRGDEVLAKGGKPQQQDIDTPIGYGIEAERSRHLAGGVSGVPGLHPGTHAGFQLGDDLSGDAGINVDARGGHGRILSQ